MRTHGIDITSSESVSYGRIPAKPSQDPCPWHRRIDPVCALFWLVLVPFVSGWFWYAIYGLIRALWERM